MPVRAEIVRRKLLEIGHEPVQALGRRDARKEGGDVRVAVRATLAAHKRTEEVREPHVGARLENAPNRIQAVHDCASIACRAPSSAPGVNP